MPTSNEFHTLSLAKITVDESRQRKTLGKDSLKALADSIKRNGLIHPIVVTRNNELVAGYRRWRAFKLLKKKEIPVHYLDELNPFEAREVELEENARRVDLTWKESCSATADYHNLREEADQKWSKEKTAKALGMSVHVARYHILVAEELGKGNKRLEEAPSFDAAKNIITRARERAVKTEMSQISFKEEKPGDDSEEKAETPDELQGEIETADFLKLDYSGRKFNFVHCDFPYGIGYDKTRYFGSGQWEKYEDSRSLYEALLKCLIENRDRLFFPSAHLMFWFSMNYYTETREALTAGGFDVNPFPLIWSKDRGIIPDPERGPRRTYETAFLASLGDRKVIRSPNNTFYHAVQKTEHLSTKPRAVLEYFFSMFVEDFTEILDPTCGSGTALAAAKVLGAKRLVGFDIEKKNVETTKLAIKSVRQQELVEPKE